MAGMGNPTHQVSLLPPYAPPAIYFTCPRPRLFTRLFVAQRFSLTLTNISYRTGLRSSLEKPVVPRRNVSGWQILNIYVDRIYFISHDI